MATLHIVRAGGDDLERYIEQLEEIAGWLEGRGIRQWQPGTFRRSRDYYAESIGRHEVQLAFVGNELVGSLRVVLRQPIVWPEIVDDDAVYVFNLAVARAWSDHGLGAQMLQWAAERARSLGRPYVRLDCMADNQVLAGYYARAGFDERGEIDAQYPAPVGTLRLKRYEKRARAGPPLGSSIEITAEPPDSGDAVRLIQALDDDLRRRYPGFSPHGLRPEDASDRRLIFLVARAAGKAVGCGAVRELESGVGEVKRMFVLPAWRQRGVARQILAALEVQARNLNYATLRLETGSGQPEAISLYQSAGYVAIPPYGEYAGNSVSRCFEKRLI
jgi:putative acetyltransferase